MNHSIAYVLVMALVACGPGSDGGVDDAGGVASDGAAGGDAPANAIDAAPGIDAINTDAGIQGCNPESFTLQQNPSPEIYLVVDRSGSMLDLGSAPPATKWDELRGAMDAALAQFDGAIEFGLLMYPTGDECNTPGPQVGFQLDNRSAIMTQLDNAVPAGGTPTAAALNNAASSLIGLGEIGSPKYIVLATDGGPNCNYFLDSSPQCSCNYSSTQEFCCTSYPDACVFGNTCLDDTGTIDVVTDLHDNMGIDTFVIGLPGTAEYVTLLDALAVAGGQPQQMAPTSYYDAANQAELAAALQTIAVSVISCTLNLAQPPDNPDGVRIYIDGTEVPRDMTQTNGWDYTDGTHTEIELFGAACGLLQDGDEHTVTATFACVVE
jgi:hypothetical protein